MARDASRRRGGLQLACVAAVLLAGLVGEAAGAKISCEETATPNVIIFYTDDQGYGDREKYNPEILSMPELETLAEGGLEFTNGHSSATVCTPSRFSILTGTYAFRQKPRGGAVGAAAPPMVPGYATLATLFKSAGYKTYMSGKWHLGMDMPEDLETGEIEGGPVDVGFDEFFGIPASMNYGHLAYIRDRRFEEAPDMGTNKAIYMVESCPVTKGDKSCVTYGLRFPYKSSGKISVGKDFRAEYCLSNITAEAISMIESHANNATDGEIQPFFMYLPVTAPHMPHVPHPDFAGRTSYGAYADFLEEVDFRLGQIVQTLKDLGLYDDTLIVYTSDNGPEGKNKFVNTGLESTFIYSGQKRNLYEGGHRVPFIMHWPNGIEAGAVWDEPVSQVDLYATFAEMVGAPTFDSLDGRDSFSLWQTMCDIDSATDVREGQPLIMEDHDATLAISCDGIKYNPTAGNFLFDLALEPSETLYYRIYRQAKPYANALTDVLTKIKKEGHSEKTLCPDTAMIEKMRAMVQPKHGRPRLLQGDDFDEIDGDESVDGYLDEVA